jgi:hypothetical protein
MYQITMYRDYVDIILVVSESLKLYPSAIKDIEGSHYSESLEVLSAYDTHEKGIASFESSAQGYNGLFTFQYILYLLLSRYFLTKQF